MIKLVATDMDGTFLDSEKRFDPEFINTFHKLYQQNIKFVVASGQQYYKLFQRFVPMSYAMYFIAENGTFVAEGSKMLFCNNMDIDKVKSVIKAIDASNHLIMIMCGVKGAYLERKYSEYEYEVKKYYLNYQIVNSFDDVDDDIIKCAIYDPDYSIRQYSADLEKQLPVGLRLVTSGNEWMDIFNDNADKGLAMVFLQEYLGIQSEECAAFGDQMNDYGMLSNVKYAYAMANAVDDIKEIAYEVIDSNDRQGVIKKLNEIIEQQGN